MKVFKKDRKLDFSAESFQRSRPANISAFSLVIFVGMVIFVGI